MRIGKFWSKHLEQTLLIICAVKAVTHLARFLCDSDWLLIVFYSHTFQKTFSDLVYFPTNLLLGGCKKITKTQSLISHLSSIIKHIKQSNHQTTTTTKQT